jgi:hypothetical protein
MGSYAECWIGNLYVASSKNGVDPMLMDLVRDGDKITALSTSTALPPQVAERWNACDGENEDVVTVTYYRAPLRAVRDRLELRGYTLAAVRRLFEEWKELERAQRETWAWPRGHASEAALAKIERLRQLTADDWISNIKRINTERITWRDRDRYAGTLMGDMLEGINSEGWYGYEGPDPLIAVRLAIEACPEASELIYDVTELIEAGYFSEDDEIVQRTLEDAANEFAVSGRTVILTEGRSDVWILRDSIGLLYPHLSEYFSFMDFDAFRVGGGAGQLANLVKAFAGAGIVNRVLAVFDNDAASEAVLLGLQEAPLPTNIVLLRLPDFDALTAYPTLGPGGSTTMNINGMAASIELYLGRDVLSDECGALTPVQWTGWISGVRKYQGELLRKSDVQERFKKKLEICKSDPGQLPSYDWAGLQLVLGAVFSAFNPQDEDALSRMLHAHYKSELA